MKNLPSISPSTKNYLSLTQKIFSESVKITNKTALKNLKLPKELYISGADSERIWQQLDFIQRENLKKFEHFAEELKEDVKLIKLAAEEGQEESEPDSEEREEEEEENDISELSNDKKEKVKSKSKKSKISSKKSHHIEGLGDDIDINDMHKWLDQMDKEDEANENSSEGDEEDEDLFDQKDEIDIFQDPDEVADEDEDNLEEEEDDDDDDARSDTSGEDLNDIFGGKVDPSKQSSKEKRHAQIQKKVEALEEQSLAPKTWQLEGEIDQSARPTDSLLREALDFDSLARTAPKITNDFTEELEEIIKSRIRDELFDDVELKELPNDSANEFKKRLAINSEKSKLSLSEIYEQDFLAATGALDDQADPNREKHNEIKNLMVSLFNKVDALSNYSFVPRPAAPEIKMVSNVPAINTEEVGNFSANMSTAAENTSSGLLAPEELSNKTKANSDLKSNDELTKTDKNKIRRDHKKFMKVHAEIEQQKETSKLRKLKNKVGLKNQKYGEKTQKLTSSNFFRKMESDKIENPKRMERKRKMLAEGRKEKVQKLKL